MSSISPASVDRAISSAEEKLPLRRDQARRIIGIRASAIVETIGFLAIAIGVDYLFFDGSRFFATAPHPFWIILLLITIQYGTGEAMLAAALCSAVLLLGDLPEQRIDQTIYDYAFLLAQRPVMWFTTAVVLGELRARQIRERDMLFEQVDRLNAQFKKLSEAYVRIERVRDNLEVRVAGQVNTFVTTYKAARAIERQDPGEVLLGVVEVIRAVMDPRKFSLYLLHNNVLEAAIQDGWEDNDNKRYAQVFNSDSAIFRVIVGEHRTICAANHVDENILVAQGVLAGPLISAESGEVIGMMKIEEADLLDINMSAVENFRALSSWIGTAYANALEKSGADSANVYVGRTILPFQFLDAQRSFLVGLARRLRFSLPAVMVRTVDSGEGEAEHLDEIPGALSVALRGATLPTDLCFEADTAGRNFVVFLPGRTEDEAGSLAEGIVRAMRRRLQDDAPNLRFTAKAELLFDGAAEDSV